MVLLFPGPSPERAREATRMGATTVLRFPMPATELRAAVTQACERPHASAPVQRLERLDGNGHSNRHHGHGGPATGRRRGPADGRPRRIALGRRGVEPAPDGPRPGPVVLGDDPTLRQAVELASTVAPARAPVLIVGEQGTGKTLIARAIHQQSGRRDQPFLEVSCGGIDELGLERELFGQKFDGPTRPSGPAGWPGPTAGRSCSTRSPRSRPRLQARLLRVLIDGEFEPLGSTEPSRSTSGSSSRPARTCRPWSSRASSAASSTTGSTSSA